MAVGRDQRDEAQSQCIQMEAMALSFPFSVVPPLRPTSTISNKIYNTYAISKTQERTLVSPTNSSSNAPLDSAPVNSNTKSFKTARRDAIEGIKTATDLESALKRTEGILQVDDYNIALRYFGESKRWSHLDQLFVWMQEHEELNYATCSTYFKYMGLSRNPVKALKAYDGIKDAGIKLHVSVCNSILGCLVKNGQTVSALKLFDQMKCAGLLPDLFTYSTLLTGCSKLKNGYTTAMKMLEEIKAQNLGMDSVIYGTLLTICASNNLSKEAELYFQQLKTEGHCPNLFHYSSLLNAYAEDRDYTKAEMLINEMRSLGITPNKVMLTTLLKVYARGGLFEKAKELLAELEALGYAQDEIAYAILIDNLARHGKLEEAKKVFAAMNEKAVKSDGYAYTIMILALCHHRHLNEAKQLAKEFESKYAKYDNVVILNALLRAYCNNGDMESVMQTLKRMDETGISPDWNTFQILIKYFSKDKLHHLAYKTIEDMNSKGYQLDEELCTSVMMDLGKGGFPSEAFSVYNMLRYSQRNVQNSLHEKILQILLRAGLLKDAYLVIKDFSGSISDRSMEKFASLFMKSGNVNLINDVLKAYHRSRKTISTGIFKKAITRYLETHEKKGLLEHLLEWMAGQGYCVDGTTRNLLLKNADYFGSKEIIAEILAKQQVAHRKLNVQSKI